MTHERVNAELIFIYALMALSAIGGRMRDRIANNRAQREAALGDVERTESPS